MSNLLADTLIEIAARVTEFKDEASTEKYYKEQAETELKKTKEEVDRLRKAAETDYKLGKDREEFIKKLQEELEKFRNGNKYQSKAWRDTHTELAELQIILSEYTRSRRITRDFNKFRKAVIKRNAERKAKETQAEAKSETKIPNGTYFHPGNK